MATLTPTLTFTSTDVSSDELSFEMLEAISLNMEHDKKNHYSGWEYWVDEYGQWFNPYKPNPNQLEIPFPK